MKMIKIISILLAIVLIVKCENSSSVIYKNLNRDYIDLKSDFDSLFVDHFPDRIESINSKIVYKNYPEANRIGFLLYNYEVDENKIDSIKLKIEKDAMAIYTSKDSCLLIIDQLESDDELYKTVEVQSIFMQNCSDNVIPIPNFFEYEQNGVYDIYWKLINDFTIYVLEADNKATFLKEELKPLKQMPPYWMNGYSKGVTLSKQNRSVIYWSIMW